MEWGFGKNLKKKSGLELILLIPYCILFLWVQGGGIGKIPSSLQWNR